MKVQEKVKPPSPRKSKNPHGSQRKRKNPSLPSVCLSNDDRVPWLPTLLHLWSQIHFMVSGAGGHCTVFSTSDVSVLLVLPRMTSFPASAPHSPCPVKIITPHGHLQTVYLLA